MTSSSTGAESRDVRGTTVVNLAWALKRALIGMLILVVAVGGAAWLLYATIEPESADASEGARSEDQAAQVVAIGAR